MKRFYPHVGLLLAVLAIVLISIASNSTYFVEFLGLLAGSSMDPILLISAILIGSTSERQKVLLPMAVGFGLLYALLAAAIGSGNDVSIERRVHLMFGQIVAVIVIAYIANAVRMLVAMRRAKAS
jgi:hypothetical protein